MFQAAAQVTRSETFLHVTQAIQAIVSSVGILVGGAWVLWRFLWQGEGRRRVSFDINVEFVGQHENFWLVMLVAVVENKGLVSHVMRLLTFDLRGVRSTDKLTDGTEAINFQTFIPHVYKKGAWIPSSWGYTFVRPGVTSRYNYVTTVPRDAEYVLLHGRFEYGRSSLEHTADKLIKVPEWTGVLNDGKTSPK